MAKTTLPARRRKRLAREKSPLEGMVSFPLRLGYDRNVDSKQAVSGGDVPALVVQAGQVGWRLDRAVASLWPGTGLRERRRRIEAGLVTVNGRLRGAAYKVRPGEVLTTVVVPAGPAVFGPDDIPVLDAGLVFGAVGKPGGLHSASLGPTGGESLEALLGALFPGRPAWLLSRLDRLTSGIVPVTFAPEGVVRWRALEDAGAVEKTYLAVVHGRLDGVLSLGRELDVADRAVTRVLDRDTADPLRRTQVTPVREAGGLTLVRCRIAKGARHQIRAHLAASGHPLVGDPVYGRGEGQRLYLHCAAMASPVLEVRDAPLWTVEEAVKVVAAAGDSEAED
ncbi:MAG: pseudouridine synthase [Desulfovibrionaceae bacterium]